LPRFLPEPTFASRYECKYVVDPAILPDLRLFLRAFAQPDPFARLRPDHRYPICSLYLDSPDLALYQQTVGGERDRFKLRLRTYTDDEEKPVFAEVKRKFNAIVHKRRAALTRDQAVRLIRDSQLSTAGMRPDEERDAAFFAHHVTLANARPVIRVKYLREAYQGRDNEPARITIDTDLMHALSLDGALSHTRGRWTPTSLDGAILEIKFTERFPGWVQDLVRLFGLSQRAVPKYVLSVDHMMLDGRETALAMAGITLPPRHRS
jgi:hypothetical protein